MALVVVFMVTFRGSCALPCYTSLFIVCYISLNNGYASQCNDKSRNDAVAARGSLAVVMTEESTNISRHLLSS